MDTAVIDSVSSLLQVLRQYRLLSGPQLDELTASDRPTFHEPHALARELLQRGWLTPFQVNQLLAGRGHSLLFGPYLLIQRLGEGATGQVFKARHLHMNRTVAVKVIRPELLTDVEVVQRFYREVQVISQLTHPHIVHAFDAGQIGPAHYLVMEFIPGDDLGELVKKTGPLPALRACNHIYQAALGLQHAHERGLVHRDIKPSNLLVTQATGSRSVGHDLVKILDLGLARVPRNPSDESVTMTLAGRGMMGTPDYLAPEQALDFHSADIRADLYSLGATFWFCLTGRPLFPGGTLAQKLMRHQQVEPPPLQPQRSDLPPGLEAIVRRLLAKRPDDRFQDPLSLAQSLAPLLGLPLPLASKPDERTLILGRASTPLPQAIPLPMARSVPETAPLSLPRSLGARRFHWLLLNGVGCLLLAGLLWLFIALLTRSGGRPVASAALEPAAPVEDPLTTALKPLAARHKRWSEAGGEGTESLRQELLAFQRDHPGTVQSLRASQFLKELPSALDRLGEKSIPAEQRRPWQPRELVAVLGEHRGRPWADATCLASSLDGKLVAGGCVDGSIHIFETDTLQERYVLRGHGGQVLSVSFGPDGQTLASAGTDYLVRLWSLGAQAQQLTSLQHPAAYVTGVAIAPGGKLLAAANADSLVHLWELTAAGWKERPPLKGHSDWTHRVAFSPDGKVLASGGGDGLVRLWDVTEKEVVLRTVLRGHTGPVTVLGFSGDGRLLVSGGQDKTLRLWDPTDKGRGLWTLKEEQRLGSASLAPGGKLLAFTLANNALVQIVDLTNPEAPKKAGAFRGHILEAHAVTFADDRTLISTGADRRVRVWDLRPGLLQERVVLPGSDMGLGGGSGVAVSPDGSTVAIHGRLDPTIQLLELADGVPRERSRLPRYVGGAPLLAFAPDGKHLASTHYAMLKLWPLPADKPRPIILQPQHTPRVAALDFAPDGKTLASAGSADQTVRLWDLTRPEPKERAAIKLSEAGNQVLSLAYAPDSKTLAVLASDKKIHLWDLASATPEERRAPLADLSDLPQAIGLSPDGKLLAVLGSKDGKATLWDWMEPTPQVRLLMGGPNPAGGNTTVLALAFAPDGKTLAVATNGPEALTTWDIAAGKKLRAWTLPGMVVNLAFAPDSRHLFTANGNGTVYVLRLGLPARR